MFRNIAYLLLLVLQYSLLWLNISHFRKGSYLSFADEIQSPVYQCRAACLTTAPATNSPNRPPATTKKRHAAPEDPVTSSNYVPPSASLTTAQNPSSTQTPYIYWPTGEDDDWHTYLETYEFLPWKWTVAHLGSIFLITDDSPNYYPPQNPFDCPSVSHVLGLFATVNAVVSVLGVILGNRKVARMLSCRILGKERSRAWRFLWVIPLGLQLGANALVTALIQQTPGYGWGFSFTDLMLFYTARPRLSWLILNLLHLPRWSEDDSPRNDGLWKSAARSQIIAEFLLELLALYPIGITVHHGVTHGLYQVWDPTPTAVAMMYGGALLYLVMVFLNIVQLIVVMRRGFYLHPTILIPMLVVWIASWLFWVGFLRLTVDPPQDPYMGNPPQYLYVFLSLPPHLFGSTLPFQA